MNYETISTDELEIEFAYLLPTESPDIRDVCNEGDTVWVETTFYGWREGVVRFIDLSPYPTERMLYIERAFITALPGDPQWSDYCLGGEVRLFNPAVR